MSAIVSAVEKNRKLILDAERYIWQNPETGFREVKTTKYMAEKFEGLGYELTFAEGITGFYTVIDTGIPGPEILIFGELDSVICPNHPESDKETGAVHSCGHNAQCATLLGIAAALKEPEVLKGLCGKIKLCAVPAEELLEIEYRTELINQGKIKHFSGKKEFLSRGYFDTSDIAFMVHTTTAPHFSSLLGSIGCLAKQVIYKGVASHAGGAPWDGKNALYAATLGINACNAVRERFKDSDAIRFHPIVTSGGSMVNAIPETAIIETYVRGMTFEAIEKANKDINQALCGAALSIGTNVEILDFPGYSPLVIPRALLDLAKNSFNKLFPNEKFIASEIFSTGSTDMGDMSCIMPTLHPYAPGAVGTDHGCDYYIKNPEKACVQNAMWQLQILTSLLENGAVKALEIINNYKPKFKTKAEFLKYQDSLFSKGNRIEYTSGEARIKL